MADPADNIRDFPTGRKPLHPYSKRAADVLPERVSWIWPGRIAVGKLTIIDGDPGLGKSTIALDIAARLTRGLALPGDILNQGVNIGIPRGVLLLSAEDGDSDTIRPRLDAAGADSNRVFFFSMHDEEENDYLPSLDQHIDAIAQHIMANNAALVIIDPLMAYLGAGVKGNNDQDVRRVLSPFTSMLERMRCSCIVLRHLNKAVGMSSLYRGGGSIGIIGAARFGLLVGKDDEDETGQKRVLAVQKCNIGPEMPSLAYHLVSVPGTDVARVEWLGLSDKNATNLTGHRSEYERAGAREAREWLFDVLQEGAIKVKELQRMCRESGMTWRTVEEIKASVGAKSRKIGYGKESYTEWFYQALKAPAGDPNNLDDDAAWEDSP